MAENGKPPFLLTLTVLANMNIQTVAVCLDTRSCVTQLYRASDYVMNPDTA